MAALTSNADIAIYQPVHSKKIWNFSRVDEKPRENSCAAGSNRPFAKQSDRSNVRVRVMDNGGNQPSPDEWAPGRRDPPCSKQTGPLDQKS
ncbi:protein of unknown function [Burkholderia multivorans]